MHHQACNATTNQAVLTSPKPVLWAVGVLLGGLVCVLASQSAQAQTQTSTPAQTACNPQASQEVFQKLPKTANINGAFAKALEAYTDAVLLPHLQAKLPECQNNVAWLVQAGQTLMAAQQYLLASDYLERAIMLEPANQGAKLDYALALAASEQPDAALSLVQGLMQEPDMPAHLQASIQTLTAKLRQASEQSTSDFLVANQSAHKFYAGLKLGRDSNLLGAPNLSELSLNFSGTPFSLPLDSSYLSQPGNYSRADAGWSYAKPTEEGHLWQWWAQARDRASPASAEAALRQASVGAEFKSRTLLGLPNQNEAGLPQMAQPQMGVYALAQAVAMQGGSGINFKAQTLGLGLHGQFVLLATKCETKLGGEWQERNLASNAILSGQYAGLTAQWVCQPAANTVWLASVSSGKDKPVNPLRAGSVQNETAARLMAKVGAVQVELEADYKRDSSIYSVLLSERPRKIARVGARLEWQNTVALQGNNYQAQVGYQWSLQKSNLQLFAQQNHGPYIGLSKAW